MLELNKVLLVGRLTRDPDYKSTTTGRAVAQFSLAVNRRSFNRDSGNQQDETTFIDVETWEKSAEFVKNYLRKGSGVYVEGRIKQDTWQDKETGQNRSKLKVVAERLQFAESKAEAERHGSATSGPGQSNYSNNPGNSGGGDRRPEPAATREPSYEPESTNDDLPF